LHNQTCWTFWQRKVDYVLTGGDQKERKKELKGSYNTVHGLKFKIITQRGHDSKNGGPGSHIGPCLEVLSKGYCAGVLSAVQIVYAQYPLPRYTFASVLSWLVGQGNIPPAVGRQTVGVPVRVAGDRHPLIGILSVGMGHRPSGLEDQVGDKGP